MSGALTAGAAVESLRNNPDKYRTLNELRELAKQVDIDSPGKVTVLYSGDMADRVSAWNVVKAMEVAGENVRLIDRTEINKFLNSREFISATADAHGIRANDIRSRTPDAKVANDWLYHATDGPWADASARFADATRGEVKVIASGAAPDRVFALTELPHILTNPEVTTIEGIPRETLAARQATHGTQSAFEMIVATSHENSGTIRTAVNAQGLPLRGEYGQLQLDNRDYFRGTSIEGRTPSFHEISRPMGDLMGAPNAHALSGRQQLDELTHTAFSAERTGSLSPRRAGAVLGVAGLALEAYDAADSVRTAQRLRSEGNATAADSELIHFGARTVGGWTGAGIGMATGAVLGVESGPGLLVTGAIGGVAGAFFGDKIAEWNDNRGIYNQELGGKTWAYDPDNPALGWRSKAPIDYSNDDTDNARRGDLRASPATENALNYQATSRSVELVLGGAPAQRDPFSIPSGAGDTPSSRPSNWQRDAESGQWQREVYGPFVERGMTPYTTEPADAARGAQLDRQAAQIVLENAANSPASIAARYEDTYIRNGWAAHGDMPDAVRNARTNIDTLTASDGGLYQRQANGRWLNDEGIDSIASGRLHDQLEATRDVLLARLPPPREILPVPPMDADARLRDTVAGAYRNASVDASAEQIAVAATAVRATWDANGLDPATTALQARPQADGQSAIASLRLDSDGKTYVIAAVTTVEQIERARTEMTAAPHAIERASGQDRDVREQATREANLQGLSQDAVQQAAQLAVAGASLRAPSVGNAARTTERDTDEVSPQDRRERAQAAPAASSLPADFAPSQQGPRDLRDPQHEGQHALREMQHRAALFETQQHIPHGPHTERLGAQMLAFAVENKLQYSDVRLVKDQDTGQVQLEHARYGHPTQRFPVDLAAMSSQPIEATSQRINEMVSRHNANQAPALERTQEQAQGLGGYALNDKVLFGFIRGGTPGHISDDHVSLATLEAKKNGIDANNIAHVSMVGDQIRLLRSGPDEKTVLVDVSKPAPPLQDSVNAVNTLNQQQAQTLTQQQDQPTQDGPGRGPKMG